MEPPVIGKDEAGRNPKTSQSLEGTQSNPKEEQPKSTPMIGKDGAGQSSETGQNLEGIQSNPKEEQTKSTPVIGKDEAGQSSEMGQNLEGTQSNPKEEQPKSTPVIGKDEAGQSSETGRSLEGTQSNPKEEQLKSTPVIGKDEVGQSLETGRNLEGTQSNLKEEQPKSSPVIDKDEASKGKQKRKSNSGDAEAILKKLSNCKEEAVVLTGDAGTGKTWLAREITKSAVSAEGSFYMSLWISLKKEHQDYQSLHQSIAIQLSIPTSAGVWEDADDIDDWKNVYVESEEELDKKIIEKLTEKLTEMNRSKSEQKHTFLLLVLDSEGVVKQKDYDHIKEKLVRWKDQTENNPKKDFNFRYLITTRNTGECPSLEENIVDESQPHSGDEAVNSLKEMVKKNIVVEIQPHSGDEAVNFLKKKVVKDVFEHLKFNTFCDKVKVRSKVLHAQIIMLAGALNHIAKDGSEALERAFDAALNILENASNDDPIPLLHFTYEKLPGDCMIDCFWHSWNVLGKHGGVQYNELITHWILEGHLDLAAGVKTAYEKGYQVMMELIDRGMLKMQEDNLIVLEEATLTLDDHSCRGLFETSNLGLASMLEGDNRKVFERMVPAEGMMKTASMDKKGKSVCSLLIDGSRLCREVPDTFFQAKQDDLKVVALFYPRLTSLPQSISKMKSLLVIVLRGCYLLNDIVGITDLKELIVLEISGSPFLKKMPDDFFANMSQLRSLNLSALGIKSLPSFSNLTELRRLILRQCSFLEELPKLANLKKLEVIDLSGSSSLKKIQEKSFKSFEKLRVIDFSKTKIEKLPIVQTLKHLSLLLVRGCECLYGLRMMKHLPSLKVLDVSGAIRIKEIYYDCFEDTDNLRILDLSKTKIRFLPDSLGKHLCDLRLKDCPELEKLPSTTALTDLESLDLSDSSGLQKFPEEFFKHLTSLQSLNLSNTKVKSLPSPFNLPNLRLLLLNGCSFESLPELKECTGLVKLDLSNCKSLAGQFPSFDHMSWLKVLNLSETEISSLPSLCNPSKLRSLILRNCEKLPSPPDFKILSQLEQLDLRGTTFVVKAESLNPLTQLQTLKLSKIAVESIKFPLLENLKKLEVLDLPGEAVKSLPSLDDLSNLRKLLLRGCSSLKELPSLNSLSHLEVLDLSGTKVKDLVQQISKLTLKCLHLPKEGIEEFKKGENAKFLPLELKLDRCCISKSSEIPERGAKITVCGTEFFKSLKEDLKKDSALLEGIKHSIFSVHSQSQDEDNYGNSRKNIFSGIYSNMRNLPPEEEVVPSLEIHGVDDFPTDIEVVLEHAKYVFLVENNFLKNLSDSKLCSLENIKGFWLERCTRMESIFMEANLGKWEKLEILWISNLPKLKSLFDEKVQSLSFGNLKKLYIDCCPMLETVFSSGKIPENLETLKIIFCDKLKTLVGDKSLANREVQTTSSADKEGQTIISANKKAQTTSSVDKEEKITSSADKKVQAQTMSSADKEVQEQTMSSADKEVQEQTMSSADKEVGAQTMSSADKEVEAQTMSSTEKKVEAQTTSSGDKELKAQTTSSADKELQAQTTSSADKEVQALTTSSADKEVQTTSGTNLKYLHMSYCPMLETFFSSTELPTILDLPNLHTLHLLELPNWTSSSITLKLNTSISKNVKVSPNIRVEYSQQVGHA